MASIESIQIAQPADLGDAGSVDPMDRPWRSAFFKRRVDGPVVVSAETIEGDGVADRVNHGGPDKAILGYGAERYERWRQVLGPGAGGGGFGENLTIAGQIEASVCVGDVYELGDGGVVLEVSQPRQPCWKVGRRWRREDVPHLVLATGFTGWYFRVKRTGRVTPGAAVRLVDRPYEGLTIESLNDMLYGRRDATRAAVDCAALARGWRQRLRRQLEE